MTPLASGTLFDRLVARTVRPERAAATSPASTPARAPAFDPFDDALREDDIEETSAARRSRRGAHDTDRASAGDSSETTAGANDDEQRRRIASELHADRARRPRIAPRSRSIADDATGHRGSDADAATAADGMERASGQRAQVSTSVIGTEDGTNDGHESRQANEHRHTSHATTSTTARAAAATSRGERERLTTIRPPLDRWTTFDDRSSMDDAASGFERRASARSTSAIAPSSSGRVASPRAGEWPDEHSSVVQPDLPIALPPRARQTAAPVAPQQEPIVHVTIGRLEIRASDRNTPARSRERPAAEAAAASSPLDQYLASRRGGAS